MSGSRPGPGHLCTFTGEIVDDGSFPKGKCDRRGCGKPADKFVRYPWGVAQECEKHAKEDTT